MPTPIPPQGPAIGPAIGLAPGQVPQQGQRPIAPQGHPAVQGQQTANAQSPGQTPGHLGKIKPTPKEKLQKITRRVATLLTGGVIGGGLAGGLTYGFMSGALPAKGVSLGAGSLPAFGALGTASLFTTLSGAGSIIMGLACTLRSASQNHFNPQMKGSQKFGDLLQNGTIKLNEQGLFDIDQSKLKEGQSVESLENTRAYNKYGQMLGKLGQTTYGNLLAKINTQIIQDDKISTIAGDETARIAKYEKAAKVISSDMRFSQTRKSLIAGISYMAGGGLIGATITANPIGAALGVVIGLTAAVTGHLRASHVTRNHENSTLERYRDIATSNPVTNNERSISNSMRELVTKGTTSLNEIRAPHKLKDINSRNISEKLGVFKNSIEQLDAISNALKPESWDSINNDSHDWSALPSPANDALINDLKKLAEHNANVRDSGAHNFAGQGLKENFNPRLQNLYSEFTTKMTGVFSSALGANLTFENNSDKISQKLNRLENLIHCVEKLPVTSEADKTKINDLLSKLNSATQIGRYVEPNGDTFRIKSDAPQKLKESGNAEGDRLLALAGNLKGLTSRLENLNISNDGINPQSIGEILTLVEDLDIRSQNLQLPIGVGQQNPPAQGHGQNPPAQGHGQNPPAQGHGQNPTPQGQERRFVIPRQNNRAAQPLPNLENLKNQLAVLREAQRNRQRSGQAPDEEIHRQISQLSQQIRDLEVANNRNQAVPALNPGQERRFVFNRQNNQADNQRPNLEALENQLEELREAQRNRQRSGQAPDEEIHRQISQLSQQIRDLKNAVPVQLGPRNHQQLQQLERRLRECRIEHGNREQLGLARDVGLINHINSLEQQIRRLQQPAAADQNPHVPGRFVD